MNCTNIYDYLFDYLPCEPSMLSRRKSSGGSPDFLAKSLANPDKIFKKNAKKNFLKILSGFASDFSQNIRRPPGDPPRRVSGGSPDNFRRDNIAGPHGMRKNSVQSGCVQVIPVIARSCHFFQMGRTLFAISDVWRSGTIQSM